MNFENLKAASIASNPHKMTSNANIQANVLKILSKLTPETDFMIRCIKELNLTQTAVKPNRMYGYYEFYIAYRNVNNKQLSSEDIVLFSTEMFNYILHDNSRLLRSCKYKNVSVVCNDKPITKEVPIPNAYVPLDDNELNALKSLTKESISSIRYKMNYMETTNESPYSELIDEMCHLIDRPIAARNIEYFYSINDMTGHIIKVSLYPADNIETINYMAKQELKSKFIKDEFKENCRKSILQQVKDYDFDTAMEKILCETFKSKDFSENEYIYGKFQFYHSTEPAYELKPDFPNVVACSRSGNSLFFEPAGGRGDDIIPDFKPKAIVSKEMSDCFWKSNEIDILLECFNMLLPSRNIFYDPYGEDEDFYNELAELIKTKIKNTGLDVIDCKVGYDSDEEKEIDIKFKNPVYKQYAQSNR